MAESCRRCGHLGTPGHRTLFLVGRHIPRRSRRAKAVDRPRSGARGCRLTVLLTGCGNGSAPPDVALPAVWELDEGPSSVELDTDGTGHFEQFPLWSGGECDSDRVEPYTGDFRWEAVDGYFRVEATSRPDVLRPAAHFGADDWTRLVSLAGPTRPTARRSCTTEVRTGVRAEPAVVTRCARTVVSGRRLRPRRRQRCRRPDLTAPAGLARAAGREHHDPGVDVVERPAAPRAPGTRLRRPSTCTTGRRGRSASARRGRLAARSDPAARIDRAVDLVGEDPA